MTLIDKAVVIVGDYNMLKYFSNIVSNLNITEYSNCGPLTNNISDPVLKCVVKYTNHPSILAVGLLSFIVINFLNMGNHINIFYKIIILK